MIFKALRERFRTAAPTDARVRTQERDPAKAAVFCAEAERLAEAGRADDSSDHYALAIAHDPELAAAWLGYGRLMRERNRIDVAITHLERAAALLPHSSVASIELARAFKQAGRTADAARAYERAIDVDPEEPAGYVNLALLCLAQLGDPARAETLLRRALTLAPQSAEAQTNLGLALHDQRRAREALAHYERLVATDPENVEYRWHLACERLSTGDFAHGWDDYEARKQRPVWWRSSLPFPDWNGQTLPSGALLLYAEQGLGDEIMFASCIHDAMRVVPNCVIECDERLASLLQRSFPRAQVEGVNRKTADLSWLSRHPQIQAQCAIGSLPRYFRRTREAFPGDAYLIADRARTEPWRERFASDGAQVHVGIAWRGGTYQTRSELRSTSLADWAPVLAVEGARFYALQRGLPEELSRTGADSAAVYDIASAVDDVEDLAAAISALDLVISVQGTVAHLAGALGRDVWILLNSSAEWRYLDQGDRMPWYASATLFRQPSPRDWRSVFEAVATALRR